MVTRRNRRRSNNAGLHWKPLAGDEPVEVLACTSQLLKIAARKMNPSPSGRRVFLFFSWRDTLSGKGLPLDDEEHAAFEEDCPVDLFLSTDDRYGQMMQERYGKPSMTLPYTTFVCQDIFFYQPKTKLYDVVFVCMFRDDQIHRKRAELFLDVLRANPHLRAAWIGGCDSSERWQMEHSFNQLFVTTPPPGQWLGLWEQAEYTALWQTGGGVFSSCDEQTAVFNRCRQQALDEGLNISFHRDLSSSGVADVLRKSRVALTLSSRDAWPRSITESLACGTPVIASNDLSSGLQLLDDSNSRVVSPDVDSVSQAIPLASSLDGSTIARQFHTEWGLNGCFRQLLRKLRELDIEWNELVDWQKPFECRLKSFCHEYVARLGE